MEFGIIFKEHLNSKNRQKASSQKMGILFPVSSDLPVDKRKCFVSTYCEHDTVASVVGEKEEGESRSRGLCSGNVDPTQ